MGEKILYIVNPVAGGGKAKEAEKLIPKVMEKHNMDYKIIETSNPKEATKIVVENPEYSVIVAVGGDGTINEVTNGILNRGHGKLGLIPCGTGNDLVRILGIPENYEKALDIIIKNNTKFINIGSINNQKFVNIASAGFDGDVIKNSKSKFKNIKGKKGYVISIIYTLFRYNNKTVEINIDGKIIKEKILMLAAGNGKYYGGGLKVLPGAIVDDGKLYICLVKDIGKLKSLLLFPKLYTGGHVKYTKYVSMYKGKNIIIKSEEPLSINIDGENYEDTNEIKFGMINTKVEVICEI